MNNIGNESLSNETMIFWGELAPSEHVAQFYSDDNVLLDSLTGFVGGGLNAGESTIVIATPEHLRALVKRLIDSGVDMVSAMKQDRYIDLDAEMTLSSFMVNDWPDADMFRRTVERLLHRATANGRKVRAFGEMVAMLWARGQSGATVRLEHLWQQFCLSHQFSLFCAYPKAGFTKDATESMAEICAAHSRVI